jgi:hypothetical protein
MVLFFDENIPPDVVHRLRPLMANRPEKAELIHLVERFPAGTPDNEWADYCKRERWLPITCDRGRRNRGPKLPLVCRALNLTHIVITPKCAAQPARDLALTIASVLPLIIRAWEKPKSTRYVLKQTHELRYTLVAMPDPQ